MSPKEFHIRIKEILLANRDSRNSPNEQFHDMFDNEVKKRSGKEWDEAVAAQVIREFEWATNTQSKRDDISEPNIKVMFNAFMKDRGYSVTPIAEGNEKTPDVLIERGGRSYLGEIKSPILNFDVQAQLYKFKTSHTKILDHIHKATKQFTEQDEGHKMPWVLVFTSSHAQLHWGTFTDALRGGVVQRDGKRNPDFSNTDVYKSTIPLIAQIDAFIWLQANGKSKTIHQAIYASNNLSEHSDETHQLIEELSAVKLPNHMDLVIQFEVNASTVTLAQMR
jgi:hypothetical protein